MPFLLPNQQCQSTEGKNNADLLTPSSPEGLPTLSLTINSSGLPRGRVDMPLVSPLMPVPQLLWLKARFAPRKSSIAALNRSATAVPWPELNKCSKLSHSTAVRFSEHFPRFSSLRHCPFVRRLNRLFFRSSLKLSRHLRSADTLLLTVPPTQRSTLGDRSFPAAAARSWNRLFASIRNASSVATSAVI